VSHFSYYLYGHSFVVFTDHKPLLQLLTSDKLNPRLRRLGYKLQGWLLDIQYLPGEENGFADALSREERTRQQMKDAENKIEESRGKESPGLSSTEGGCGGNTSTERIEQVVATPPH